MDMNIKTESGGVRAGVGGWCVADKDRRQSALRRTSTIRHTDVVGAARDARRLLLRMLTWWFLVTAISLSNTFVTISAYSRDAWQKPGCHKVGHTRKISVPDCVEFQMKTNACRGYCESWAVPSGPNANPTQPVTSVGQCCNIMDTETVEARVLCVDGVRTLKFKSAISCSCYHCKKD